MPETAQISLKLTLSTQTYSFSNPTAPDWTLEITSHASRPITFFTWGTPLSPQHALTRRGILITELGVDGNNARVNQPNPRVNRAPPTRVHGSLDDPDFLTVPPQTTVTLGGPFTRTGVPRPRSKAAIRQEEDAKQKQSNIRYPGGAVGVDGLDSGKRYRIDVDQDEIREAWWRWGTREDILVSADEPDRAKRMLSSLDPEEREVEIVEAKGVEFSVKE